MAKLTEEQKHRIAGASLLGAASFTEGFAALKQKKMLSASIEKRTAEISERADISIANILRQGEKVQGAQETAFAKAGVKLEGSALNVLTETAETAIEAARIKQREADFEVSQLQVQKAVAGVDAKFGMVNTLLGTGMSAGSAFLKAK